MISLQTRDAGRRRMASTVAHILFIVIIFVLPELLMAMAMPKRGSFLVMPGFYVRNLFYILVFYLNYFYIVDSTFNHRKGQRVVPFIALNLVLLAVGLAISYSLEHYMPHPRHRHGPNTLRSFSFLMRDGVMIILTIGLAVALRLSARLRDIENQRRQFLSEQQATELASLKSQLNPHFLFNTLNTIYALIDVEPEDAKKAVHRLSGMLRYVLYEDVKWVSLLQEADFIRNYVDLMRLRIANRTINVDINLGGHGDVKVPPLLFIPIIENAFKYGTEDSTDTPVELSLEVSGDTISCRTVNSVAADSQRTDEKNSGIGLANLRRRLQLLYDGEASLETRCADGIFSAILTLPLKYDHDR